MRSLDKEKIEKIKKALGLGGIATATGIGYLLKDKIGSGLAYLIDGLQAYTYLDVASKPSYTSVVPLNRSRETLSYYLNEVIHPSNAQLINNILTFSLLIGLIVVYPYVINFISRKMEGY